MENLNWFRESSTVRAIRDGAIDLSEVDWLEAAPKASKWILLDYRCPSCNRPVIGREDVKHVKRIPKVEKCQHCKCKLVVARFTEDLGPEAYFDLNEQLS